MSMNDDDRVLRDALKIMLWVGCVAALAASMPGTPSRDQEKCRELHMGKSSDKTGSRQ